MQNMLRIHRVEVDQCDVWDHMLLYICTYLSTYSSDVKN